MAFQFIFSSIIFECSAVDLIIMNLLYFLVNSLFRFFTSRAFSDWNKNLLGKYTAKMLELTTYICLSTKIDCYETWDDHQTDVCMWVRIPYISRNNNYNHFKTEWWDKNFSVLTKNVTDFCYYCFLSYRRRFCYWTYMFPNILQNQRTLHPINWYEELTWNWKCHLFNMSSSIKYASLFQTWT